MTKAVERALGERVGAVTRRDIKGKTALTVSDRAGPGSMTTVTVTPTEEGLRITVSAGEHDVGRVTAGTLEALEIRGLVGSVQELRDEVERPRGHSLRFNSTPPRSFLVEPPPTELSALDWLAFAKMVAGAILLDREVIGDEPSADELLAANGDESGVAVETWSEEIENVYVKGGIPVLRLVPETPGAAPSQPRPGVVEIPVPPLSTEALRITLARIAAALGEPAAGLPDRQAGAEEGGEPAAQRAEETAVVLDGLALTGLEQVKVLERAPPGVVRSLIIVAPPERIEGWLRQAASGARIAADVPTAWKMTQGEGARQLIVSRGLEEAFRTIARHHSVEVSGIPTDWILATLAQLDVGAPGRQPLDQFLVGLEEILAGQV